MSLLNNEKGYISYLLVLVVGIVGISQSSLNVFDLRQDITKTAMDNNRLLGGQINLSAFSLVKASMVADIHGDIPIVLDNGKFTGSGTTLITSVSGKLQVKMLVPTEEWDNIFENKPIKSNQEVITEVSIINQYADSIDIQALTIIPSKTKGSTKTKTIAHLMIPENKIYCNDPKILGGDIRLFVDLGSGVVTYAPYRVKAPCNDIEIECSNFRTNHCLDQPSCISFRCEYSDGYDENWLPLATPGNWVLINQYP